MTNFTTQPTKGLVVLIRHYPGNPRLTAYKPTQTNISLSLFAHFPQILSETSKWYL
jgi:hypothetical protein